MLKSYLKAQWTSQQSKSKGPPSVTFPYLLLFWLVIKILSVCVCATVCMLCSVCVQASLFTNITLHRIAALKMRKAGLVPGLELNDSHPVLRRIVGLVLCLNAEHCGWRQTDVEETYDLHTYTWKIFFVDHFKCNTHQWSFTIRQYY